jgi:hypothetical protein
MEITRSLLWCQHRKNPLIFQLLLPLFMRIIKKNGDTWRQCKIKVGCILSLTRAIVSTARKHSWETGSFCSKKALLIYTLVWCVHTWLAALPEPHHHAPGWAVTWHEFTLAPAHITCLPVKHSGGSWWWLLTALHSSPQTHFLFELELLILLPTLGLWAWTTTPGIMPCWGSGCQQWPPAWQAKT